MLMSLEPNERYPRLHFAFYQDDIQLGNPDSKWQSVSCKIIIFNLPHITIDSPIMQKFFAAEQKRKEEKLRADALKEATKVKAKGHANVDVLLEYNSKPDHFEESNTKELSDQEKQAVRSAQSAKGGLMRIVHQYKNLLTEGDVDGKNVYQRKLEAGAFLQNQSLRLPIAYPTYFHRKKGSEYVDLHIDIIRNTAAPAVLTDETGEQRDLTDAELANYMRSFGTACLLDLEFYIQERQAEALRTQTEPDFYGFQSPD